MQKEIIILIVFRTCFASSAIVSCEPTLVSCAAEEVVAGDDVDELIPGSRDVVCVDIVEIFTMGLNQIF